MTTTSSFGEGGDLLSTLRTPEFWRAWPRAKLVLNPYRYDGVEEIQIKQIINEWDQVIRAYFCLCYSKLLKYCRMTKINL